ncbi:MAG: lipoyl synthase [bacterium]
MISTENKSPSRLPIWITTRLTRSPLGNEVRSAVAAGGLHTICQEARCPNRGECWDAGTATFLILGNVCTRNCLYCGVRHGAPAPPDLNEPARILDAVRKLGCRYVVITSVTRDDLPDGGAVHFVSVTEALRKDSPDTRVELLVPDFRGDSDALKIIVGIQPDVLGHNLEIIERLFPSLRPQGSYKRSLALLEFAKKHHTTLPLKSGLMVGLGETREEISEALRDLFSVGVNIVTVGQYLRPNRECVPVVRYLHPDEFEEIRQEAIDIGFSSAVCGPLVRSSYHAEEAAENI